MKFTLSLNVYLEVDKKSRIKIRGANHCFKDSKDRIVRPEPFPFLSDILIAFLHWHIGFRHFHEEHLEKLTIGR